MNDADLKRSLTDVIAELNELRRERQSAMSDDEREHAMNVLDWAEAELSVLAEALKRGE